MLASGARTVCMTAVLARAEAILAADPRAAEHQAIARALGLGQEDIDDSSFPAKVFMSWSDWRTAGTAVAAGSLC